MQLASRYKATPEMWQETYLSAVLRAILYSDDSTYELDAYRRLQPIATPDAEIRFLQAAEELFMKGEHARLSFSCYIRHLIVSRRMASWF